MTNIFIHLFFAKEVYRNLKGLVPLNQLYFMSGNLIPDLAVNKEVSHYETHSLSTNFKVPDIKKAKKDLFNPKDSLHLGLFSHLFLDYHFIEDFLIPNFIWDYKNNFVINPINQKGWDIDVFFSDSGLYSEYTQINHLLLEDKYILQSDIESIPVTLPTSGIDVYDNRREKTWKEELDEYLSQDAPYIGDVLSYGKICDFVKYYANEFKDELVNSSDVKKFFC